MRPNLHRVDLDGPGELAMMAHPRGLDWLGDEMAALAREGVDIVVCALTEAERDELGLADEEREAGGAGLRFVGLPVADRGVWEVRAVLPRLRELARALHGGASIVTHCRYGIGRASVLAGALLVLNGADPEEVWPRLERARGLAVPDTAEQRRWIAELAAHTHG
ncbi:protein-tyrosine phosphatase [Lipingzhangella halophila]|uniref:Protein-tyrosine phosphatase n=1 Tax=Lipingzhangella halophila TaxID=1783352 RepID=A0A7W7RH69_9ACTN|nr:tyrosine protein phosphatase [Lipingzhangella halophila]MBB4931909.1 protein-tyrosine phosphatase [Lipingzhangella halophila]